MPSTRRGLSVGPLRRVDESIVRQLESLELERQTVSLLQEIQEILKAR
jgi:hypothetical protein